MAWSNEPARCHSNWANLSVLISALPLFLDPSCPVSSLSSSFSTSLSLPLFSLSSSSLHLSPSLHLPKCSNEKVTADEHSTLQTLFIIRCQRYFFHLLSCCLKNSTLVSFHLCHRVIIESVTFEIMFMENNLHREKEHCSHWSSESTNLQFEMVACLILHHH